MAKHSISAAARLVGISRQTLYKDIQSKGITVEKDDTGKPQIDTSELLRVYQALQGANDKPNVKPSHKATPGNDNQIDSIQAELDALRREKFAALEARAEAAERERDEWRNQARSWQEQAEITSRLLVDQRPSVEPAAPVPTPSDETPPASPSETRQGGFWSWLRGE